jgi:hypothetical protein
MQQSTHTVTVIMETFYLSFVVQRQVRLELIKSETHRTGTKNS